MAAPRITFDPALESCPDHSSASFKSVRDLIIAGSASGGTPLTDAGAAILLSDAWNQERDVRQVVWDAQVQADATSLAAQADSDRIATEAAAEAERIGVQELNAQQTKSVITWPMSTTSTDKSHTIQKQEPIIPKLVLRKSVPGTDQEYRGDLMSWIDEVSKPKYKAARQEVVRKAKVTIISQEEMERYLEGELDL
ncbi:hypothetical protein B0H16DRAFT_1710186 [Mycena metata]|uniref:Uncharacterized protein n=1 Tax=Mycena metata TaxID=1033252 RepID=A0AAD7KDJ2_9AGAR|nr:hypothetical protein B0H16DRAFT_1710186 [Mycena metata]